MDVNNQKRKIIHPPQGTDINVINELHHWIAKYLIQESDKLKINNF